MKPAILIVLILLCSFNSFSQQGSLLFDGVNDKVVVPANAAFNSTSSITCEAWINATQWKAQIYQGTIIGKDGSNTSGYALRCGSNGKLSFVIGGPGGWTEATCGSIMQANVWTHVAGVFDNGSVKIYVNGNLVGSATSTGITNSSVNLLIGESPGFAGRVFKGYLDEIRIWSTARTQSQISANMTVDLPNNEPGLVAYYKFNQISGTTTPNEITTTTNSIGTLTNFPANPWSTGYSPPTTDLAALSVISPDIITFYSGASRVRAGFKNSGVDTVYNFFVGYRINNGNPLIESVSDTLLPGQEYIHAFNSVVEGLGNSNNLKIFTSLAADNNTLNDTLSYTINRPANNLYNLPIFTAARHNFGAFGQSQHNILPLPDNNSKFSQIIMKISVACPTTGCDPWDQPAKISLVKNGQTFELARFITPYGKACGPWTIDITDFKNLLQGSCDFESYIQVWGSSGWLLNVSIDFVLGNNPNPYQKITRLWENDNWVYGDPNISYDLPNQSIAIHPMTQEADLRITNTGHGQANTDNAAEFSQKTHSVVVNSTNISNHTLWKANCAQNSCSNQSGTWTYNRAGWCPGQGVDPFMVNLSGFFTAGQNLSVDYVLQPYTNLLNTGYNGGSHTEPHYKIHAFLVEKSTVYIEKDSLVNASSERISFPLSDADLSATTSIKTWIKNRGTTNIANPVMFCYVNGALLASESTTLTLLPGDSIEYTFNATGNFISGQEYHIASMVAATSDEASSDDVASIVINNPLTTRPIKGDFLSVSVIPNPNPGSFKVVSKNTKERAEISILEMGGKELYKKQVEAGVLERGLDLSLLLKNGFYILKLSSESSMVFEKLTIQK